MEGCIYQEILTVLYFCMELSQYATNYIPEISFRGYYGFGLDAASAAAARQGFIVFQVTATPMRVSNSY